MVLKIRPRIPGSPEILSRDLLLEKKSVWALSVLAFLLYVPRIQGSDFSLPGIFLRTVFAEGKHER